MVSRSSPSQRALATKLSLPFDAHSFYVEMLKPEVRCQPNIVTHCTCFRAIVRRGQPLERLSDALHRGVAMGQNSEVLVENALNCLLSHCVWKLRPTFLLGDSGNDNNRNVIHNGNGNGNGDGNGNATSGRVRPDFAEFCATQIVATGKFCSHWQRYTDPIVHGTFSLCIHMLPVVQCELSWC